MLDWFVSGARKAKRNENTSAVAADLQGGLIAGTLVATTLGWRPIERLCVGDEVMTFDDGVQEVTGVTRRLLPMTNGQMLTGVRPLVSLPADLIGNRRPMLVPEGQALLIESDFAEAFLGDPFAALDASELIGLPGVRKMLPEEQVIVVTLSFNDDQMIFVEGNALALCPATRVAMPMSIEEAICADDDARYRVLSHDDAEMIVAGMGSGQAPTATHPAAYRAHLS